MPNFPTKVTNRDESIDETDLRGKVAASNDQMPEEIASKAPLGSLENPYKLGERGSGIRSQGAVQDFHRLRKKYHEAGMLFEDPEFLADDTSLFGTERDPAFAKVKIIWKRPIDLVKNPQLYVDGISRFDVKQGVIGDCWLVSALANLAMNEKLLHQVVPQDQSFDEKYAGIFHFRFWQAGKWVEVVIDDRLPTRNGKLLFVHSQDINEFWGPLVEKAYAKLNGYYYALKNGLNSEALEDFTGGIAQLFPLEILPPELFDVLLEIQDKTTLMGCVITEPGEGAVITKKILEEHGLYAGHAYSITKVMYYEKTVKDQVERIPLLRIRNPWGIELEWKGAWSEGSPEWKSIPEDKKKEFGFVAAPDGEFWISFEDWKIYFTICEICYVNPSSAMTEDNEIDSSKNCYEISFDGEWVVGSSAGGSITDLGNFQHNPQYLITLKEESEMIVGLMRKNRRTNRPTIDMKYCIGFHIYKLPGKSENEFPKPLDLTFFKTNDPIYPEGLTDSEPGLLPFREVTCETTLQPGSYCIIVSTSSTDKAAEYLLRVFSKKPIKIEEYDVEIGFAPVEKMKSISDEDELISLKVFRKLAGDDWEFDWKEEKEFLDNKLRNGVSDEGFSDDFCRSMVTLLDADDSGKISYHEFKIFWNQVIRWKAVFKKYDEDGSGKLKPFQLREALESAGYTLNKRILNLFQRRYGDKDGYVKFQDYIMCLARLEKMIGTFKEVSSGEMNSATVTLEKWIKMASNFA